MMGSQDHTSYPENWFPGNVGQANAERERAELLKELEQVPPAEIRAALAQVKAAGGLGPLADPSTAQSTPEAVPDGYPKEWFGQRGPRPGSDGSYA